MLATIRRVQLFLLHIPADFDVAATINGSIHAITPSASAKRLTPGIVTNILPDAHQKASMYPVTRPVPVLIVNHLDLLVFAVVVLMNRAYDTIAILSRGNANYFQVLDAAIAGGPRVIH